MEGLVLLTPCFQCLCYNTDAQKHILEGQEGAMGLMDVWFPGFAIGKLWRREGTASGL